ncbi:uncharacterized protein LOC128349360 [Hemicordylus capensis]|uniref:uncharacterized protein LOC128349360 n=1 Tax=Hemicordylus capensis TaxID=884348 RepID=UPI002304A618|nr:uncharacterized protein LOC128349360 [Hemicordylus capensis]
MVRVFSQTRRTRTWSSGRNQRSQHAPLRICSILTPDTSHTTSIREGKLSIANLNKETSSAPTSATITIIENLTTLGTRWFSPTVLRVHRNPNSCFDLGWDPTATDRLPLQHNCNLKTPKKTNTRNNISLNSTKKTNTRNNISLNSARITIKLASHAQVWHHITSDQWVLSIVAMGYVMEFKEHLPFLAMRYTPESPVLWEEVQKLLLKEAISPVQGALSQTGFYSRYFLIPKRDGGIRPIMDLHGLNQYIEVRKFRMTTLQAILLFLHENWIASLDLKDAYFHVSIQENHCKYLRFTMGTEIY